VKKTDIDWKQESERFDEAAKYYDLYRPSYPNEMIEIIINKTGIQPGAKILEIGAGSGKATELFVKQGYDLVCIEPGENFVKVGQQKYKNDKVKFILSRFEEWDEDLNCYDFAFSAQAFHWVPKPIGFVKCKNALKSNKYFAQFWNWYPLGKEETHRELAILFEEFNIMLLSSDEEIEARAKTEADQLASSNYFKKFSIHRFPWMQQYKTDEFIGYLKTGNDYLRLNLEDRLKFIRKVQGIFDNNEGLVNWPFLCVLFLAEKVE
jgi:SAM-dependent methyltransferase